MKQAQLLTALVACAESQSDGTRNENDRTRFLVTAVFEGMLEDFPEPALFEPLVKAQDKHFVAKCPVRRPAMDGIKAYRNDRQTWTCPLSRSSFPEEIRTGLKSRRPDHAVEGAGVEGGPLRPGEVRPDGQDGRRPEPPEEPARGGEEPGDDAEGEVLRRVLPVLHRGVQAIVFLQEKTESPRYTSRSRPTA
jgi:hypothetical protein